MVSEIPPGLSACVIVMNVNVLLTYKITWKPTSSFEFLMHLTVAVTLYVYMIISRDRVFVLV